MRMLKITGLLDPTQVWTSYWANRITDPWPRMDEIDVGANEAYEAVYIALRDR